MVTTITANKEAVLEQHGKRGKKIKTVLEELFGREVFLRPAIERIKTLQDALDWKGETLEQFKFRTERDTDQQKATKELELIAEALREGEPLGEKWFYPYFVKPKAGSGSGFSFSGYGCDGDLSYVGARLCVDTSEKAIYMGKQFIEIYNRHLSPAI